MTLSHDGYVELTVAHVTKRDSGLYTCVATNEVGRAESVAKVEVDLSQEAIAPPEELEEDKGITEVPRDLPYSKEPKFLKKPRSTDAFEGDDVVILCEVIGDPKP
ncbi:Immunoglobulin, partial [Oryctes borbonicus]